MNAIYVFNGIILLLVFFILAAGVYLIKSLFDSLYHYRNVMLIAGIIFSGMLIFTLYSYLIECLMQTKELTLRYIFKEFVNFPNKFANYTIPVFAIICLLITISNISLIRHEGLRPKNLLGVLLGGMFVGGTFGLRFLSSMSESYILSYVILFCELMLCYLECFFLGTVLMAYLAAKQKPRYDKDYAIILGCSIDKKGGLLPLLKGRTNRAIKFAWEQEIATGKSVRYIPSGGQGPNEIMSEGSAMELYLLSHGAESDEVYAEKESRNTYENFAYSKKIIDGLSEYANVCFVTTNYHMYRSGLLAQKAGINAEGIASRTKWYFWPNGFVREFFAILLMHKKVHICFAILFMIATIIFGTVGYFISI